MHKKAQTFDHVVTMKTIASKYKKLKKPVFVNFRKAFESVRRQALFFKLAKIGITGNFYEILKLRNMSANSYAHIKFYKFMVA